MLMNGTFLIVWKACICTLEIDARAGTRYKEILAGHFGVTVPDFRLQRAEYLGGGTAMVNISPVTQTNSESTPTGALTPMGLLSKYNGFPVSDD